MSGLVEFGVENQALRLNIQVCFAGLFHNIQQQALGAHEQAVQTLVHGLQGGQLHGNRFGTRCDTMIDRFPQHKIPAVFSGKTDDFNAVTWAQRFGLLAQGKNAVIAVLYIQVASRQMQCDRAAGMHPFIQRVEQIKLPKARNGTRGQRKQIRRGSLFKLDVFKPGRPNFDAGQLPAGVRINNTNAAGQHDRAFRGFQRIVLGKAHAEFPAGRNKLQLSCPGQIGDLANVAAHLNPAAVFRARQGLFETDQRRIRQIHDSGLAHNGIRNDGGEFARGSDTIHLDQHTWQELPPPLVLGVHDTNAAAAVQDKDGLPLGFHPRHYSFDANGRMPGDVFFVQAADLICQTQF